MQTVSMDNLFSNHYCEKYNKSDVVYSLICLEKEDFIQADFLYGSGQLVDAIISDITNEGHDFIEKVRKDTFWNKFKKSVISTCGSVGLSVLSSMVTNELSKYLS